MKRLLIGLLLAIPVTQALAWQTPPAAPSPPAQPRPAAQWGPRTVPAGTARRLTLGGITVLQFRVASGGFTPEQRASKLQDRVVDILSHPELRPKDVHVVPGKGGHSATVMVGPLLFVTVTEADAQATQSTPEKLAMTWAENFRQAYAAARPKPIRPTSPAPGG
jgi:hypothetical protein